MCPAMRWQLCKLPLPTSPLIRKFRLVSWCGHLGPSFDYRRLGWVRQFQCVCILPALPVLRLVTVAAFSASKVLFSLMSP